MIVSRYGTFDLDVCIYGPYRFYMSRNLTKNDVPKNPAGRRAWILYQLRLRNLNLRKLGEKVGVSRQAMSYALHAPNSRGEAVIAEALGLKPQELFPERFDASGNRYGWTRDPNRTTRSPDKARAS